MRQQLYFWVFSPKKKKQKKTVIRKDKCTPVFIEALFTVAKIGRSLNVPDR